MEKDGLFEPCYSYYVMEIVKIAVLWYMAAKIVITSPTAIGPVIFAAFLHSFGNQ